MRLRVAGLLLLTITIPTVVSAVCQPGPGQVFSQYYDHVRSWGTFTPESTTATFWALGFGDPAPHAGTDSGSFSNQDWIVPYGVDRGLSIIGSWSQSSAIDGCIDGKIAPGKSAEIMVVEISDRLLFDQSLFAIAAVAKTPAQDYPAFDFSAGLGRDIMLTNVPQPIIVSSLQVDTHTLRFVFQGATSSRLANGFYSDGSVTLPEVVPGYRMYVRAESAPVNPDIHREGWSPLTSIIAIDQPLTLDVDCTRAYLYFANSLVFESGLETPYLSDQSTRVNCQMCFGDRDGDGISGDPHCGAVDCDDADPNTHPGAVEINDGKDNQCPGESGSGIIDEVDGMGGFASPGDKTSLSWPAQAGATGYQLARSTDPALTADCSSTLSASPSIVDVDTPAVNAAFYYVIRATAPHLGSWGTTSAGMERSTVCP